MTLVLDNLYSTFIFYISIVSNALYDNHVPQSIDGTQDLFLNTDSVCFQWRIKLHQLHFSPCFLRFRVVFVSGFCKINLVLEAAWGESFMTVQREPVGKALVYKVGECDYSKLLLASPQLYAIVQACIVFLSCSLLRPSLTLRVVWSTNYVIKCFSSLLRKTEPWY